MKMNEESQTVENDAGKSTQSSSQIPAVPSPPKKQNSLPLIILALLSFLIAASTLTLSLQQNPKIDKLTRRSADLESQLQKLKETNNAAKINNEDKVDHSAFQAVFLTSGQVYFGKITAISDTQITLNDIYYLRVNGQNLTPSNINSTSGGDISLVKLGNELHGPQDVMYIERKETVFWENLKQDSQVSKAITEFKKANP